MPRCGILRRRRPLADPVRIVSSRAMRRASEAFAEFHRSESRKSTRLRGSTHGGRPILRPILWGPSRTRRWCGRPMVCSRTSSTIGAPARRLEPEMIRVPTLLILAEWDQDTPLYMAQEIFAKRVHAPYKRHVLIGEGTHAVAREKNRMHLINQVQSFLDEQ